MTTYADTAIDFSTFPDSDGEPVAENGDNLFQMIDMIFGLRGHLEPQGHHVGGNLLMYYNPASGWDHVSPDVFVALHAGARRRRKWETRVEGTFPEVVFEVTSPSTEDVDLGHKVHLYARLGVQEYYIFDPSGELQPPFRAYGAVEGQLEPLDLLPSGGVASALLGLEIRPIDAVLRAIDPATGRPLIVPDEARAAWRAELEAREAVEARLADAEARLASEAAARQTAEASLQDAMAELARLRAAQGRGATTEDRP